MAYVGLRKPIIGKKTGNKTYEAPFACGKAIGINVNPVYSEGSLNGDDGQAEYDKEFNYADVTLNTTTLPVEAHKHMFGREAGEDGEMKFNKDDQQEYVGFGWVSVEKVDGKRKFVANFLTSVKFAEPAEEYATKGENIEYKTPSITGRALSDDDGDWKFNNKFDTEKEALDYIYKKFGHTETIKAPRTAKVVNK